MRLKNLFEDKKTAAFAVGRLNPATTGHELLVNAIKQQPGDHFLFLTDRAPKLPDNPLSAQEKLDWAKKSFPDINVELAQGISLAAHKLYKMGYRKVIFLEGEKKLYNILTTYNGKTEGKKGPIEFPYNFDSIDYVRLERDAEADDATGMSGTKLRSYVIKNNFEKFKNGVTNSAKPYAEDMFKKLQGILGVDAVEEGYTKTKNQDDLKAKKKAIQDIQSNPNTSKDPELKKELAKRKAALDKDAENMKEAQLDELAWLIPVGGAALRYGFQSLKFIGRFVRRNPKSTIGIGTLPWTGPLISALYNALSFLSGYGIPIAVGVIALYGGKKLYDALKDKDIDTLTDIELTEILKAHAPKKDEDLKGIIIPKKTNEIMSFATTRNPKRATIKRKPEKFEPSTSEKVKIRRQAFARGDKNAFSKDWTPKGGW